MGSRGRRDAAPRDGRARAVRHALQHHHERRRHLHRQHARPEQAASQNAPGTSDAIGAFTSINTALQVGTFPPGTTLAFAQNSADATLNLPAGQHGALRRAHLGRHLRPRRPGYQRLPATIPSPSSIPQGGPPPSPRPDVPTPARHPEHGSWLHRQLLLRSDGERHHAVRAGGGGTYTVGGIPATVGASENTNNCAGWTLAVVYQNFSLPVRNLALFVGSELSDAAPASTSRLLHPARRKTLRSTRRQRDGGRRQQETATRCCSAQRRPLSNPNQLKGPNNPPTNFFASQINRDDGTLDTSGTFGTRNANAFTATNISGGRQGWDITNVDVSAQLQNDQTQAFARGTTTGDTYVIIRPRAPDRRRRAGLPAGQVGRQGDDLRGRHAHVHDDGVEHRDRRRHQRHVRRSAPPGHDVRPGELQGERRRPARRQSRGRRQPGHRRRRRLEDGAVPGNRDRDSRQPGAGAVRFDGQLHVPVRELRRGSPRRTAPSRRTP